MSSWGLESSQSVHGDDHGMLRIISPPLGKIRPRIENQITMGKRWLRRVEVDVHQVLVILKLEMGTLQCRTVL